MPNQIQTKRTKRKRLEIGAIMAALSGALFMIVLLNDISSFAGPDFDQLPWTLIGRYVLSMIAGGAIAGYLFAGKFGRPGFAGWISATLWGLTAILVAGFFGSLIGMLPERLTDGFQLADLIAVAAGGLILPFAANDSPWLLLVIPLAIGSAHFRSRWSVGKH